MHLFDHGRVSSKEKKRFSMVLVVFFFVKVQMAFRGEKQIGIRKKIGSKFD